MLTGKMINAFPVAATSIEPNDLFGIAQDVGGGVFQTKKAARKLLPDITMISRTTDLVRTIAGGDDDQLFFAVKAGVKYYVRTRLIFNIGGPTVTVQYLWTKPALATGLQDILYFQSAAFAWKHQNNAGGPPFVSVVSDAGSTFLIATDSLVFVPSADGTVLLNWTANVGTVTLVAGSWLEVTKVAP